MKSKLDLARRGVNLILPPAENAARTQIIGTLPTYEKAGEMLSRAGAAGRGLDFGAGLGEGAKRLPGQWDTYEPFAKKWQPTYSDISEIPEEAYGQLTNLNVLNVVPREIRDEIVQGIGRSMHPGGLGILTTRGKDVMSAKGRPGPEPMSIITSRDTYQKGFTNPELQEYLRYMLGDRFDVTPAKLGPAGAMIRKKAEGGLAHLAGGGKPVKMLQQFYRGFAGKPNEESVFVSPQKRVADYYAAKRSAQTGLPPGVEAVLADPFAGRAYGHALPIDRLNREFTTTQARELSPLDVISSQIIEKKKGGSTTPAWQRKEGKNPEGGLNAKGRASYKAETGGTLKRPQPEGGPRRDSFCARMEGAKKKLTSAETARDPDSRINKALRKWNC
jgi:hypothetical protein